MLGAGRSEDLRAVFGAEPFDAGEIFLKDAADHPPDAPAHEPPRLGYTPEDRKEVGSGAEAAGPRQSVLASLVAIAPSGFITRARRCLTCAADRGLAIKVD